MCPAARIELARELYNVRKQGKVILGNVKDARIEHPVDVIVVAREASRCLFRIGAIMLVMKCLNLLPKCPLNLYDGDRKGRNAKLRFCRPDKTDDLLSFANDSAIQYKEFKDLLVHPEVLKMYEDEIKNLINSKTGFKLFERINKFVLLEKPFEVGVELSAKQEIMRYKMASLYPKQISQLFKD